jgi:signal transduction histidine kinase
MLLRDVAESRLTMSAVRRFTPLPYTLTLSPQQMLVGMRWLVVAAAGLLALRAGTPAHQLLQATVVLGLLLIQQTADLWLAARGTGARLNRWLLCIDLLCVSLATAFGGPAAANFFLVYPLLLVEAALTFTPSGVYSYTAALSGIYAIARIIGTPAGMPDWIEHGLLLTLLEVMLFFIVTGISSNIVRTWTAEQEHIVQLSLLDDLSLLLADTRQLDDVLERLVELVPRALHVQACAVAVDEPGSGRRIWANLGADTTALIDEALLSRETSAAVRRQPQRGLMRFPVAHTAYGAIYTLPLAIDERSVGMLSVARLTPQPFGERDRRLFESLARHAAQALRNVRLYRLEAEAAEQSRELERFKSEMLASVSHEFRLPISSISLAAETLLAQHAGDAPEAPEVRLLRNIQRSAQRLDGFVQDVLDLARLDAHQLELRLAPCDVVALAHAAAQQIEPQCEMKRQRLALDIQLEVCWVRGDAQRLEQVLSNLLTNAHQYTPEDGAITLILAPAEEIHAEGPCGPEPAGTAVAIGVRDTGPGVAPEERARIFERFQRGAAGKRRSAGAGLGLHIARSVVDLHGGCLWVEDNPAGGSTFWCKLPRAVETAPGTRARSIVPVQTASKSVPLRSRGEIDHTPPARTGKHILAPSRVLEAGN